MICTFELGPLDGERRDVETPERGFHITVAQSPAFGENGGFPYLHSISYEFIGPDRMILSESSFGTLRAIGYFAGEKYEKMRAWDSWE